MLRKRKRANRGGNFKLKTGDLVSGKEGEILG